MVTLGTFGKFAVATEIENLNLYYPSGRINKEGKPIMVRSVKRRLHIQVGPINFVAHNFVKGEIRVKDPRQSTGKSDPQSKTIPQFTKEIQRMLGQAGAFAVLQQIQNNF